MKILIRYLLIALVAAGVLPLGACSGIEGFNFGQAERSVYRIYTIRKNTDGKTSVVSGTGFLISGVNNVATNYHVINQADEDETGPKIYVAFLDQGKAKTVRARVRRKYPPPQDLAILEADRELPGQPLTLSDLRTTYSDGADVKAIGYPASADMGAFDPSKSPGVLVPSKTDGRISRSYRLGEVSMIQHQAPISNGNSGGPLMDACGTVIGVNTLRPEIGFGAAVNARELVRVAKLMGLPMEIRTTACNSAVFNQYFPLVIVGLVGLLSVAAIVIAYRRPGASSALTFALGRRPATIPAGNGTAAANHRPTTAVPTGRLAPGDGSAPGQSSAARGGLPLPASRDFGTLKLVPVRGGTPPLAISLDRLRSGGVIVGRDRSSDLVIPNDTVSKQHARMGIGGDQVVVEDLGSGNGTWHHGERITSAMIGDGDELKFGDIAYKIELKRAGTATRGNARADNSHSGSRGLAEIAAGEWKLKGVTRDGTPVALSIAPRMDRATGRPAATEWTIGRSQSKAELVIDDASVSSVHAKLRYSPGRGLEIADANSTNGSKLNGEPLSTSFVPLAAGQSLELGSVSLSLSGII